MAAVPKVSLREPDKGLREPDTAPGDDGPLWVDFRAGGPRLEWVGSKRSACVLVHCKNNAIHCNINDICIAWVLIHCKNNAIHYNINDICIAWVLIHDKNNTVHYNINDI